MVRVIDKGNGVATVLFSVEMPMDIYNKFKNTVEVHYGNTYWLYIKNLMMIEKAVNQVDALSLEIQDLRQEFEEYKESNAVEEEPRGLGSAAFTKSR